MPLHSLRQMARASRSYAPARKAIRICAPLLVQGAHLILDRLEWTAISGAAARAERASGDRYGEKGSRIATSFVGEWRSLRTVAQLQSESDTGGGIKSKTFCDRK